MRQHGLDIHYIHAVVIDPFVDLIVELGGLVIVAFESLDENHCNMSPVVAWQRNLCARLVVWLQQPWVSVRG
jgi:hypothetical protein